MIALAPDVATWASKTIETGHPGFRLKPLVLEWKDLPEIRDRAVASRLPELAVLSAMAHPEPEIANIAMAAIKPLPEEQAKLYLDLIFDTLSSEDRRILEAQMLKYEYKSDLARRYYGEGRDKGREEGRAEGREEGRAEERKALCRIAIELARAKLAELSEEESQSIRAFAHPDALADLILSLAQATTAGDAREVLRRTLAQ